MLGAKIAVAFNHIGAARGQLGAGARYESALCFIGAVNERLSDAGAEPLQDYAICGYVRAQPAQVGIGRCGMRLGVAKKAVLSRSMSRWQSRPLRLPRLQRLIEHRVAGQTTHLDQIFLDAGADTELQRSRPIRRQHLDRLVHSARQTPVEPQFLAAAAQPRCQRAVVHAGMAQRLLELVRIPRCQEQPGEMSLDARNTRGPLRIMMAITSNCSLSCSVGRRISCVDRCGRRRDPPWSVAFMLRGYS